MVTGNISINTLVKSALLCFDENTKVQITNGTTISANQLCKGKSLSEVLIYSSINPQYDNRLFNDFQVQYKKITRVEHVKNMLFTQIV